MAGFWTSAVLAWLWVMPGLPFGLSKADYSEAVVSALILNGVALALGGAAFVLRSRVSRSGLIWRRLALHDPLTGLANRTLLNRYLEDTEQREEAGVHTALLFLDLDHFKEVNDQHGHVVGDKILIALADRLGRSLPAEGMVARYGGDEFVVLLPGTADLLQAERAAKRILGAIREPFRPEGLEINISASIGAAISAPHGPKLADLLTVADRAAYAAKVTGKGRYVISKVEDGLSSAA